MKDIVSGMLHSLLMFNKIHHKNTNTIIEGKSFCKSFHRIGGLSALMRAPVMTASASPATEWGLINPIFVRRPLIRTNIFYVVRPKSAVTVFVNLWFLPANYILKENFIWISELTEYMLKSSTNPPNSDILLSKGNCATNIPVSKWPSLNPTSVCFMPA